ncbi:MAG: succinyl-diaminopimelate desuccinylase [Limnohabitans sp.]|nr:succinyl-diaminopimelate desuccinylase [Limnohabitans sp.]
MSLTLDLAEQLIACPSVTPEDAQCLTLIAARLTALGFICERMDHGPDNAKVSNLWAIRRSALPGAKTLVLAGHTDVVPTGPLNQWSSDPFTPTHRDGKLFGRGASDMKTSLAAMVVAAEEFFQSQSLADFSLAFLLTSDEEGPSVDGTVKVVEALKARGEILHWCIVGEPTSVHQLGDMVKNGRRGTLSGKLTVQGLQGHIAYPQLARNPIHLLAPALAELTAVEWDKGNAYFQPTGWQVSNIHAGTGANNVIPGQVVVDFNFRFSTESTAEALMQRLEDILKKHHLQYTLKWTLGGLPFITTPGDLLQVVQQSILKHTGLRTELSTTGGTSDARFIAQICRQVIEFGPRNDSIHQINEFVRLSDIDGLKNIYLGILNRLQQLSHSAAVE